jgi:ribosomal-protein-alanine N-acetyltransferase
MILRDMPEVLAIEAKSYADPWGEEEFVKLLRQQNCIGWVATMSEVVVGFCVYELHARKLQLLNLAVDPDWRRRGIGTAVVDKLKGRLSPQRRNRLEYIAAADNLPSHQFLRSCGLLATDIIERDDVEAYRFEWHYTRSESGGE